MLFTATAGDGFFGSRLGCMRWRLLGSTIVDGPEVPEDRDPAQREAEGPRSSMDYSEFPLLDFFHQKKKRSSSVTTQRNRRSVRRPTEGSEVTMALYGTVGKNGEISTVTVQGPQKPRPDKLHFHSNFERECL